MAGSTAMSIVIVMVAEDGKEQILVHTDPWTGIQPWA